MDTVATTESSAPEPRSRKLRWLLGALAVLVLAGAGAGVYAWRQLHPKLAAKYSTVAYTVPSAPHLVARDGETVLRIDPTQSSVSYAVSEKLLGQGVATARGTTNGIAGDIALNRKNPATSRVGEIVVDVKQLHSDNNQRDARLRASYLQSYQYPLARLRVARFDGMPAHIVDGTTYHFSLASVMTIKQTPAPVTWSVDGHFANGKLVATAVAHVKMSTFHVGPISIIGLLSTGDDVTLTMQLTAVDPAKYTVPTAIAAPKEVHGGKLASPSFRTVVMPILQANCASCHNRGQVGAAHWKLYTAADAHATSDGVDAVVKARYMPPWPASTLGVPLAHSKQLDQRSIDALVAWSEAGGPLDVPATTPIAPTLGPAGKAPRQDVVMRPAQGYVGDLNVPNDYRCFVLDPHITKPMYLTGYTVTPDHPEQIHHVQIFHIDAEQAASARARDGSDGKPGFTCYGTPALGGGRRGGRTRDGAGEQQETSIAPGAARGDDPRRRPNFSTQPGLIAGWVPGQDPAIYPEHSGILLLPGDEMILQVHYHYDLPPVSDRTSVALQLDPDSPSIKPIDIVNPIGPVEIPCDPGVKAPLCDRSAALADDARLYGPQGAFIEPGLLLLCHHTADELAATYKDGVAHSSCTTSVPEDGVIVAVLGHMHTLGKGFRFTLDPGTDHAKVLLDIPTWNFDWQMNYELQTPIHVTAGQQIQMDCSWDRSLDPNRAPKYIVFAEGTEDEMCFGTYAIIPDKP